MSERAETTDGIAVKAVRIASGMFTVDLAIKTAIRIGIGASIIASGRMVPEPLAHWAHLAGTVFLMFAFYQAIGHAEGKFMAHAVSWLRSWKQRHQRNRDRMAQLAHCRRCGCSSCPYDPANQAQVKQ